MKFLLSTVYFILYFWELGNCAYNCSRLRPLYQSFRCRSLCKRNQLTIKFDCTKSDIYQNYTPGKCYFNGSFYNDGDVLFPNQPNYDNTQLCRYFCRTTAGGLGGYFTTNSDNCADAQIDTSVTPCAYDTLYNQDYFMGFLAPVIAEGRECPTSWIATSNSIASDDCSANQNSCCRFYNNTFIKLGRTVDINSNYKCVCNCPPLIDCVPI